MDERDGKTAARGRVAMNVMVMKSIGCVVSIFRHL